MFTLQKRALCVHIMNIYRTASGFYVDGAAYISMEIFEEVLGSSKMIKELIKEQIEEESWRFMEGQRVRPRFHLPGTRGYALDFCPLVLYFPWSRFTLPVLGLAPLRQTRWFRRAYRALAERLRWWRAWRRILWMVYLDKIRFYARHPLNITQSGLDLPRAREHVYVFRGLQDTQHQEETTQ